MKRRFLLLFATSILGLAMLPLLAQPPGQGEPRYRSPYAVAFSPDGKTLAVSDHTGGKLVLVNAGEAKVLRETALNGRPAAVAWSADGAKVYVAELGAGTVAEVSAADGKVTRRLEVGPRPVGVALAPKTGLLLVTDDGLNQVLRVDLASGKERSRVSAVYQPGEVAVSPDESLAAVANTLPLFDARSSDVAAAVSIVDIAKGQKIADVQLPAGSTNLRGIVISPDGRWAYVAHTLGRYALPTTQIERGWINTNAVSVIDVAARKHYATVLLDQLSEGAADPWGLALAKDGGTLWVALAGVHQVARLDLKALHELLEGKTATAPAAKGKGAAAPQKAQANIRQTIQNDLAALYVNKIITRTPLAGNVPRGLAISPDSKTLAAAMYFSGEAWLADAANPSSGKAVALGPQPSMNEVRRGEMLFNDGTYCFQHWLSCATCHPHGGRADGLNWDLLNDGIGNPKNTKSLVWSHKTPPVMSLGVRGTMDEAVEKGFQFIQFREVNGGDLNAVRAYLRSLEPEPSPHLEGGKLSVKAQKGKAIFEDSAVGCAKCHPGPLFTDLKKYDVGTTHPLDRDAKTFDNPTLIELWRTAPFLHDGSARTLREVLIEHNKDNKHGKTSHLSPEQIDALVEYMLSL